MAVKQKVGIGHRLDSVILEVFFKLSDSMNIKSMQKKEEWAID